jgi:hypothetical protein
MDHIRFLFSLFFAIAIFGSPASAQTIECHAPLKPMLEIDLMFGRNIGDALGVSESDWTAFVETEITPRFPEGFSVGDALGQWRDRDTNAIVEEPSKSVEIVVPQDAEVHDKVTAIVEAYKTRFRQQAVGVIMRPACVSF